MFKVPEWAKTLFFIKTEELRKISIFGLMDQQDEKKRKSSEMNYSFTKLNLDSPIKSFKLINNHISNLNCNTNHNKALLNPERKHGLVDDNISCIILNKITKFIRLTIRKLEEEKIKLKNIEEINIEWKELARKLENVFFVITFGAIIIMPVFLFGKFVIRDIKSEISSQCGCENSFVRNH